MKVNPAEVAALAQRLITDDIHAYPMREVTAKAEGEGIVVRALVDIDGHDYRFAAHVPVPHEVGDTLWRRFEEEGESLELWVVYAVQILFVEAVEAGGLSTGKRDANGVYWLDIWNQAGNEK